MKSNKSGSCQNTKTIVTTYDKYDNQVSKVENSISNGKPLTTIDKYQYTADGKILSDSISIIKQSKWEWGKTLEVIIHKYDEHGNLIYYENIGGEYISNNSKTTRTFNEKNMLLEERKYNSCSDVYKIVEKDSYYPDGVTIKEQETVDWEGDKKVKYGKDGRRLESLILLNGRYTQEIDEYEE